MMVRCWAAVTVSAAALLLWIVGAQAAEHLVVRLPAAEKARPTLLLLSSLPLLFGEDFALTERAPTTVRLAKRYEIRAIALADAPSLAGQRLLLMAHPRAQTAEALVDLDAWVRRGGRLLLLADPALDWASRRPLGDRLRPPPTFADTGLLVHWGIRLAKPPRRGVVVEKSNGRNVTLSSAGELTAPRCVVGLSRSMAQCRIGRGKVTVIADADLLDPGLPPAAAAANSAFLLDELARLDR